jgi:diguanylate cyclase (GGDEF)-like protein
VTEGPRAAFLRTLEHACGVGAGVTLLLVDADDFAPLAARLGPLQAAKVLEQLEHRLESCAPAEAAVSRTGGDGLAVVLPGEASAAAEQVFARLRASLRDDPPADGPVDISGGIATGRTGERPVELLARASGALEAAKQAGKGTARAAL